MYRIRAWAITLVVEIIFFVLSSLKLLREDDPDLIDPDPERAAVLALPPPNTEGVFF